MYVYIYIYCYTYYIYCLSVYWQYIYIYTYTLHIHTYICHRQSISRYNTFLIGYSEWCSVLQCVACSVLQCVAVCLFQTKYVWSDIQIVTSDVFHLIISCWSIWIRYSPGQISNFTFYGRKYATRQVESVRSLEGEEGGGGLGGGERACPSHPPINESER